MIQSSYDSRPSAASAASFSRIPPRLSIMALKPQKSVLGSITLEGLVYFERMGPWIVTMSAFILSRCLAAPIKRESAERPAGVGGLFSMSMRPSIAELAISIAESDLSLSLYLLSACVIFLSPNMMYLVRLIGAKRCADSQCSFKGPA